MTEKNQSGGGSPAWLEIARPGRFQDSGGAWHEFTAERLAKMAEAYDPGQREAPLVLGHPATNGPAHGWIKALKYSGRKLLAQAAYVSEEVRRAVDNGLYKYVSMSLYQDGGLRHVGLLGAVPPAISGLAPVTFGDDAALVITFNDNAKGSTMELEELQRKIGELEARLSAALEENADLKKKVEELEGKLEKTEDEAEKTETEFAAYRDSREKAEVTARLDGLVQAGKLTPAERPAAEKTAESLRTVRSAQFNSGETPLEGYLKSLEARAGSPLLRSFGAPPAAETAAYTPQKPLSAKL